jgi:hypothetical protein
MQGLYLLRLDLWALICGLDMVYFAESSMGAVKNVYWAVVKWNILQTSVRSI